MSERLTLSTGADLRVTNGGGRERAVLCVNGGQSADVAGTWSATLEWLVRAPRAAVPGFGFGEVRYRTKSWNRLDSCIEDTRAGRRAHSAASGRSSLGFSMGGAVAIAAADEPRVERIVGLAPWIPDELGLDTLKGKRLDVLHGSLDRYLPGIPGVAPASSRRGFDRAGAVGATGTYTLIRGAVHGVALRVPGGRLLPLPRAGQWLRLVASQLDGFTAEPSGIPPTIRG